MVRWRHRSGSHHSRQTTVLLLYSKPYIDESYAELLKVVHDQRTRCGIVYSDKHEVHLRQFTDRTFIDVVGVLDNALTHCGVKIAKMHDLLPPSRQLSAGRSTWT